MSFLFDHIDPHLLLIALLPLALAAAAWALRMACTFVLVEPPTFWHAIFAILVLVVANVAFRFFVNVTQTPLGIDTQYVAPAIVNAVVFSITLPVNPVTGMLVAVVHACLCCVAYLGLSSVAGILF